MKNGAFLLILIISISQISCDKIDQPSVIITDLDTNLFPGNFIDYKAPTFDDNTNTLRNVLIEDYTGHFCGFCPGVGTLVEQIEDENMGRVFVVSIHASPGPGGLSGFQYYDNSASKYNRDFTTIEGRAIAEHLSVVQGGIVANPTVTINRVLDAKAQVLTEGSPANVTGMTDSVLQTPLQVNLQVKSSYFPSTKAVFLHTEVEFLTDLIGEYAVTVYAVQNEIVDWQLVGLEDDENYKHHNVHIGNVFSGESFGRVFVNGEVAAKEKFMQNFSYEIPDGLDGNSMHFQIYVYNKATEEILQVIEHRF